MGVKPPLKVEHLNHFINRSLEESLNLDYQAIPAVLNYDELSQDVSAFANSAGGLLVLGVGEKKSEPLKPGLPGEITWTASYTKEAIESALLSRIHPWIEHLAIHPVRNSEGKVVFLFDIPQSMKAHQAGDKRYYMRHNFQKLPMEHYQIVDLMNRRSSPILKPIIEVVKVASDGRGVTLHMGLVNEGNVIAKHPLLFIKCFKCEAVVEDSGFFGLRRQGEEIDEDGEKAITITGGNPWTVIHPQIINYFGNCVLSFADMGCSCELMVGCEGAPTERYWVVIGQRFLKGLTPGKGETIRLSYWTTTGMTAEMFEVLVKQWGIGEPELKEVANSMSEAFKKKTTPEQAQVSG